MCGLVGFIGSGSPEVLKAMTDSIAHRGPDGEGFYFDDNKQVALGHRRLSIIDIEHGHQPMLDNTQQYVLVFNGEIYNHSELRKELIQLGHQFQTDHCDSEVLLYGYKQWGRGLPARLNGMFAFAVYDKKNQQIFMARDRFGKKPLYYFFQNGVFGFASELKAFFQHPAFEKNINTKSLQKFFAYSYLPAPNTQYNNAFKLPGGHTLMVDIPSKNYQVDSYWEFRIEPDYALLKTNPIEIQAEIIRLFSQAVKRRLMSDVPLGVFLSGGVDSSAILRFVADYVQADKIKTFSIGFNEPSYDESPYADEVAKYIGSNHFLQKLTLDDAKAIIPEILTKLNEPLADSSIIPTYLVSKFASQKVKVILSGDGGDELFAGYAPFKALKFAQWYQRMVPRIVHNGMFRLVDLLPKSHEYMGLEFKARRFLTGLNYPKKYWQATWLSALEPNDLADLFHEKIEIGEIYSEIDQYFAYSKTDNIYDASLEYYTKFYLQDDILTKVDRASMYNSLECRAPFLDIDLVNFVRTLPFSLKYKNGETKYILKKSLGDYLPKNILYRRKQGFAVPVAKWLSELDMKLCVQSDLSVKASHVDKCFREHKANKHDHRIFLWAALVLNATI